MKKRLLSIQAGFSSFTRLPPFVKSIPVIVLLTFWYTSQVYAAGVLSIEIVAGYNLVVDSNVLSPSTYAPSVATVMGRFCNTGDATLTNIFGYIGDSGTSTPGTYPTRDSSQPAFIAQYPHLANTGLYSFTHVGGTIGTADATRFIGSLAAGECKAQYWHFTYPRRSNPNNTGPNPVWGQTNSKTDDLSLEFDIWGTSAEGSNNSATHTMTMRNEISAMANKIKPNPNGQWFNTNANTVLPGDIITSNGIDYELGVINQGFDNDGDLVPDFNAWLQPIGDPAYDPSCFRLIHTEGYLTISRSAMPDLIVPFDDQLYFTNLPINNNGVVGRVYYTFMAMNGPCSTGLTPYQEVASGYENEKFNGDYGTGIPPVGSSAAQVTIDKSSSPTTVPVNSTTTYSIPFANSGSSAFGLGLSTGGTTPLVISDEVPDGMQYVGGSATAVLTYVNTGVTILYSTNNGTTWSTTDPGTVTSTWPANKVIIQWWLNDALPAGSTGNYATFQARVPGGYTGTPFIENCAEGSLGSGAPFAEACSTIMVPGNNSIGDFVWQDIDGDGVQDGGSETGIANITVNLYYDADGDGILDADEPLINTTSTSVTGLYSFTNLPDGNYIVVVDDLDTNLPTGYAPTTTKSYAVPLDPTSSSGTAVNYATADFGFGPSLRVTKSLTSLDPAYVGEEVTFNIDLTNTRPGDGTASGFCTYTIWASIAHVDNTLVPPGGGPTNAQWQNTAYALSNPDFLYSTTAMNDNTDWLGLSGFNTGGQVGNITNVELLLYVKETTNLKATDNFFARVFYGDVQLGTDYAYNGGTYFTGTGNSLYTISQDITALRAWRWADFANNATEMQLEGNRGGGGGASGDIGLDAAAYVITTDQLCGGADSTISYLPLADTFNTTYLQFVSAVPMPSSTTPAGTLTWANLGPLYAGGTTTVEVTFRALAPITSPGTTNTASVTNPTFMNGRNANNGSDNASVSINQSGSIAGTIWADTNNSGWSGTTGYNAGDGFLGNVQVHLYACVSNYTGLIIATPGNAARECTDAANNGQWVLVDTTTTNGNGNYSFTGLRDGYYNVKVVEATLPATFTTRRAEASPAGNGAGAVCGTCDGQWNTDAANLNTFNNIVNGGTGENITNVSFGYRNLSGNGAITGYVWNDIDQDGIWDTGEQPISGVTVYLCTSATNPCDANGDIIFVTTDANGFYSFEQAAGNYRVGILTPNSMSQSGDTDVPNVNCGGSCDNQSNAIALPAQGVMGQYNFGYFGGLSIGDTIYTDWNGDGDQDSGEEGISGITVYLYRDTDRDGVLDSDEPLLATEVTDGSGIYGFDNLPGNGNDYLVVVNGSTLPTGYIQTGDPGVAGTCSGSACDNTHPVTLNAANVLTADFGYQPQGYASIGDYVWYDTNGDGIQDATETAVSSVTVTLYQDQDGDGVIDPEDAVVDTTTTNGSGNYSFTGLAAGNYIVQVASSNFTTGQPLVGQTLTGTDTPYNTSQNSYRVSLGAGETFTDADFGYTASTIGDFIWQDNDGDGEQDSGEPGISGVTVYLCTSSPCTSGNAIATDVTDSSGLYEFGGLTARTGTSVYVVAVDTTTLPGGFTQSGDPDRTSNCAAGGSPSCDNASTLNLDLGQVDRSRDFGYQPTAFVGDTLWIDADNDGARDVNESGISDITMRLCSDPACTVVVATTTTDDNGNYSFGNLSNATYYVSVLTTDPDMPAGLTNTFDPDGTTDSVTQVVVSGNQVSSVGGVACSNCSLTADFGYRYTGSNTVSGTIFFDSQNNGGIYNAGGGDTPFAGITVYLYNSSGDLVTTTTTDSAGGYNFTNLPNGTFTVSINSSAPQLDALTQRSEPDQLNCGVCNNYTTFTLNNANLTNQDFGFFASIDCGDAPAGYDTLLVDEGPCHVIGDNYLGGIPDAESNGQPDGTATGDGADEDGVSRDMADPWLPNTTVQIDVTIVGTNGYLIAWFDWNNDGDFSDAGESTTYGSLAAGTQTLNINVPAGYTTGQIVNSRFRLYDGAPATVSPTGVAVDGEVEDYQWTFSPTAVTLTHLQAVISNPMILPFVTTLAILLLITSLVLGWSTRLARRTK